MSIAPMGVAIQDTITFTNPAVDRFRVATPMPLIAPTIAWEVLIGNPRSVIMVAVTAADTDTMIIVVMVY